MCEIQDFAVGHKDIYIKKYSVSKLFQFLNTIHCCYCENKTVDNGKVQCNIVNMHVPLFLMSFITVEIFVMIKFFIVRVFDEKYELVLRR